MKKLFQAFKSLSKKMPMVFILLAVAGLITACGGGESSAPADSGQEQSEQASGGESVELKTADPGVLTVGTNAAFPPYEYYEGDQIVGIDAEITAAIAEKLNLELKIEDMEFGSLLATMNSGKIDACAAGMTVTEERLKTVNFTETYAQGVQVVIVKEDSPIASIDDLKGKKIGVQIATTGDIYASDDFGEENVDKYDKGADAVMALQNDKVDAVIIDNEPAKNFVANNEGLKILDTEYAVEDYAIAVSKDNEDLLEAINTALAELKEEGRLQEIIDKYIPAE